MATNFGSMIEQCDDCKCQSTEQLTYRVEVKRRLCDKCAHKRDDILDVGTPTRWTCDEHTTEVVKAYCKKCKKGICNTCGLLETHRDHEKDDIANVVKQSQDELQKYLRQLGNKKEDLNQFETRLSQCADETQTVFKAVNDDIMKAVEEDKLQAAKMRQEEAERVFQQAQEEIRVINERVDQQLMQIEKEAEEKKKQIMEKEQSLTNNLTRISQGTADKIAEVKRKLNSASESVDLARSQASAAIKSGMKEQVSQAHSLREILPQCLSVNLSTEEIDSICTSARKVKFVRKPVTMM